MSLAPSLSGMLPWSRLLPTSMSFKLGNTLGLLLFCSLQNPFRVKTKRPLQRLLRRPCKAAIKTALSRLRTSGVLAEDGMPAKVHLCQRVWDSQLWDGAIEKVVSHLQRAK